MESWHETYQFIRDNRRIEITYRVERLNNGWLVYTKLPGEREIT